jgi:murein DD-endopeptidase MepM/ murein hydrolase activator NlpD
MEFVRGLGAAGGGSGFTGFADRAGLEGLSGFRPAREGSAPERRLPGWLWRTGAALLALGAIVILVLSLGNRSLRVPAEGFLPAASTTDDPAADLLLAYLSPELEGAPDEESVKAVPLPRALELSNYTVRPGDSIGAIAKRFSRSADSILSVNGIKSVKALKSGAVLRIPNMDGVLHVVARGESLGKIAKDSKVEVTAIVDANDLGSSTLKVGQSIFIPGARLNSSELQKIYGTTVLWPVRGPISSYFGIRSDPFTGVRRFHGGIDIVVDMGTPVKAAMDGRVADLGYNANYGNYVIMNNGDGIQTLYGHLSGFCVTAGQSIAAGAVIAKSGNTGYSTGPHLHFGVYKGGTATNPLKMLK